MGQAFIGLAGLLIGILLNEYFRRRNCIEGYSLKVFEKRLEIYEGLFELVQDGYQVAVEVIENTSLSSEERHDLMSSVIMPLAHYSDKHALYLNPYLSAQATALFMGIEDIQDIEDSVEREAEISNYMTDYKKTKLLIIEEAGVSQINKHFSTISKASEDTPVMKYIKEQEKLREYQ